MGLFSPKWTLLDLFQSCDNLRSFKQIHAHLIVSSMIRDEFIVSKVVEFFGKYSDLVDYACGFFNQIDCCMSSFPYNTLISVYAGSNAPAAAILAYKRLVSDGFLPDAYTFPVLFKSLAKFLGITEGRQVHGVIAKMGFSRELYVHNSLLHFYGVCGECSDACRVFDEMLVRDVVSWTGLMSGFVRAGLFNQAVNLFLKMDVEPNKATFVSLLVACGRLGNLGIGKVVHGLIFKRAFGASLVLGNALLDMYVKCECLGEAKQLFHELPERDIVSWTSVISGLVQCKRPKESLEIFNAMLISGVEPDRIILTSVLSACASLGALDCGRWVQEYIDHKGIKCDTHIGTSMVDMYAKCGCIETALLTFNGMPRRNIFTWNALLGGLAMHGLGHEALRHFDLMVRMGTMPNEVTFLVILTACCHSGLVDEGCRFFYQMERCYSLSPRLEHYGCMVDLLCRAELLDEALELIGTMPMPPDVLIWGAILSACKAKGYVEFSPEILDGLVKLEAQDSGVYVLLSNIYASNERWNDVKQVRRLMNDKGIRKVPGSSVIELNGKAHEFIVGATSHSQNEDIHVLLNILANQVCLEGNFSDPFLIT
ncbi:pentatricopeptide repeat-containing protein At4g38010 [Malania oleifera]|uniref:pentatricopeptide repeat-containing protein At4g38010 n=1 Tax=Malania oleifera TaxID=397392 RepID=UPI0025AE7FDF|nr:pentatricopeptide repeat-containing protein At4g38010 [Malania oleifera]